MVATAPLPSASTLANGSLSPGSMKRPLDPTQIAPEVFTAGSRAAANPPSMGSSPFGHATRLETITSLIATSRSRRTPNASILTGFRTALTTLQNYMWWAGDFGSQGLHAISTGSGSLRLRGTALVGRRCRGAHGAEKFLLRTKARDPANVLAIRHSMRRPACESVRHCRGGIPEGRVGSRSIRPDCRPTYAGEFTAPAPGSTMHGGAGPIRTVLGQPACRRFRREPRNCDAFDQRCIGRLADMVPMRRRLGHNEHGRRGVHNPPHSVCFRRHRHSGAP